MKAYSKPQRDGRYWTVPSTGPVASSTGSDMLITEMRHPGSLTPELN
jgi:hypothetical protein